MISALDIQDALRTVIDPELGINVVDLGLVYEARAEDDGVHVVMSMTSAACPMHNLLSQMAEAAIRKRTGPGTPVTVDVVFDPPWSPDMMSAEARRILG